MEFTVFDLTSRPAGAAGSALRQGTENDSAAYEHTIEQACIADAGGLDAYYLTEHHFNPGFHIVPSPHLLVAALSQRTTRIRLGVMCTNLTLHHPVRVCEEIRMMDLLTAGRLEIGFGRGAVSQEQTGYGAEPADAESLFDHSIDIVNQLLTTGHLDSYSGGPWSGTGVVLVPQATQQPHPPLWIAAVSDASLRKAASLGLSVCTAFLDLHDALRSKRVYQDAWAESHPHLHCGKFGMLQHVFVAESEQDAYRWAGSQLEGWFSPSYKSANGQNGDSIKQETCSEETKPRLDEAVASGRLIYGTPDQCVAQLLLKADSGLDMFQGWFQFGGLDYAASDRSLKLFCEEVVPVVRAETRLEVTEPPT